MDRRRFLGATAAVAAWWSAAACGRATADRGDGRIGPIGLQLYTVRSLMAADVEGTLEAVASIGYEELEFAGYFDRSPRELRATLDGLGLRAPSTHLSLPALRQELDAWLEAAGALGHGYLILPSLPLEETRSPDDYRRLAEEMNGFGERCGAAGVRFGFHNHDAELREIAGEVPLRILIEETEPDLVTFELDLFWLVHGGGEPLDYIEAYPGRFELCHVKDRTAAGEMADVGAGVIDFAAIFERSARAGLIHYFVEHDRPGDAVASITASYRHLASL